MDKCVENILVIFALCVGIPLGFIFYGLAFNIIHIFGVVGEKLEQYIGERIDKQIYNKQKKLRKEIDGD